MNNTNEILLEEIKGESESYTDDALFNISSFGTDLTFRELITMYKEGELEKPELQRKYVWTKNEASRFIDSILLGLPVPSIFLAKTEDEKRLIVDGYQRIMTVYDFTEGVFSGDQKIFKLSNSENINERWRGKAYKELSPEEQRKIKMTTIHAIVFEQKYPQNDTGMYQIFERINTSGRVLKPQEIRNCVYHGEFNSLLFDINKDLSWRKVLGTNIEDARMADLELILRFFAFINFRDREEKNQKQINLVKYLNTFMNEYQNIDKRNQTAFKKRFITTINYLYNQIGDAVFRSARLKYGKIVFAKKVNPVIFDAICTATDYVIKKDADRAELCKESLKENYLKLLTEDEDFNKAITIRTTNTENIRKRINISTETLYGLKYEW